jgi:hypothetical protein
MSVRKKCGPSAEDLTGKRFGHLTALRPTDKQSPSKQIVWECLCDCGNLTYRTRRSLKVGQENANCGCLKSDISKTAMKKAITHTNNTIIEVLESKKLSVRNKSGVRGVFFSTKRNRWVANICFQNKNIRLGLFDTLEDAAKARKRAEEEIYEPFLVAYYARIRDERATSLCSDTDGADDAGMNNI